jgi:hypothetical protein
LGSGKELTSQTQGLAKVALSHTEKQLSIHFDLIRRTEKDIGEIPVDKVAHFRLLREVRRELSGK